MEEPPGSKTKRLIARHARGSNRNDPETSSLVGHQTKRRPRRFGKHVHLFQVKFRQFEVRQRGFLGGGGTGTVEFLECTIRVVADAFSSRHWKPR